MDLVVPKLFSLKLLPNSHIVYGTPQEISTNPLLKNESQLLLYLLIAGYLQVLGEFFELCWLLGI